MMMRDKRYDLRRELNELWTIIDTYTGLPAASDGKDLTGLEFDDARDLLTLLNDSDSRGENPLV